MKNLAGGDPRESVGGICESPKFKMAAVGQVDNCILSVIWGREFISDVGFIVLHTAYLESKFKMAAVAYFEYNFNNLAYSAAQ